LSSQVSLSNISQNLKVTPLFKEGVATKVLWVFIVSVAVTGAMSIGLAVSDACMIWHGIIEPSERLISEKVVMALIGATIVQLGAALATIILALFKNPTKTNADGEEMSA
jgi:uncharacterized membrane protein